MAHMKTATIRDLRDRYTSLLRWLRAGEEIVITRRGKAVAKLVPMGPDSSGPVDWSASPALTRDRPAARRHVVDDADIVHDASGRW